jgi:hypothetical protein
VRTRKVRVLHADREFYLIDSGRDGGARVLTMLERCAGEPPPDKEVVHTDLGPFLAIAHWRDGALDLDPTAGDLREPFTNLIDRYLADFRTGKHRVGETPHYFLSVDNQALCEIDRAWSHGLCALLFSDRARAEQAARLRSGTGGREITVEATGDLADFLEARAAEGFAGALLDDDEPIFTCADSAGNARFLRIAIEPESGDIEHFLLEDGGRWRLYEGQEEIDSELEIDQDFHDAHLRDRLGVIPFVGYFEGMRFRRLVTPSAPDELVFVHCDDDFESVVACPVFFDDEAAAEFITEHELVGHETREIDDLHAFVTNAQSAGKPVRIHPEGHRARSGTLWSASGVLFLDTFSGLWRCTDGRAFERVED